MHVDELISHLNDRPLDAFIGVKYDHKKQYVELFIIYKDTDDENFICVDYEAGCLFSSDAEEGSFSIEEVKEQIQFVDFNLIDRNSWEIDLSSEYSMHNLFPDDLQDPEDVFTQDEKHIFASRLDELINGKIMCHVRSKQRVAD